MFKNGFRYNGGSIPEVSTLEKVEFLKGSYRIIIRKCSSRWHNEFGNQIAKFQDWWRIHYAGWKL